MREAGSWVSGYLPRLAYGPALEVRRIMSLRKEPVGYLDNALKLRAKAPIKPSKRPLTGAPEIATRSLSDSALRHIRTLRANLPIVIHILDAESLEAYV